MGQQQLILLVLATVIVGIAIVIGIRAFTENSIKANSDAMVQDIVRIASDAQAWKQKPAPFGGQADGAPKLSPTDFTGFDWIGVGYQENAPGIYTNLNGIYRFTAAAASLTLCGFSQQQGNYVEILVDGMTDADITQNEIILGTAVAGDMNCTGT